MDLSNRRYDQMKKTAQIGLPALATLVGALATIYGWDNGAKMVLTITAINVFLGTVTGYQSRKYANENAVVREVDEN